MPLNAQDAHWLAEARALAEKGRWTCSPNPMVGALVVRDNAVVGRGHHQRCGEPHAEVIALREAGAQAAGATLFVTLEPCSTHGRTPPCCDAIVPAGLARVVAGTVDPNPRHAGRGLEILRSHGIAVDLADDPECARLNEKFNRFITTRMPFVHAKWAMTLDGKIAARSGDSRWISCEQSRVYAQLLRSEYDCVMAGIGTVIADNPRLNVRLQGDFRQPVKVIVDSLCRLQTTQNVVCAARDLAAADKPALIIACGSAAKPADVARLEAAGVTVLRAPSPDSPRVNLRALLGMLGEKGLSSVLVEGGAQVHGSLFDAGLVQRVTVFIAPKIIGGREAPSPIAGTGIERMASALPLTEVQTWSLGEDVVFTGRVAV